MLLLPRASWKMRLLAGVVAIVVVASAVSQWPHRHDELAIARWMAWFNLAVGAFLLTQSLIVCVLGRVPRSAPWRGDHLRKTLPEIHAEFVAEREARRRNSREL
ncbi:hypothetical protein [Frateuria defendens]|uniref:hypothetical protein n=1 Tax=Frateuria defendens TaxID=2219559 RepID=UPI0013792F4D|nr:hypothetical protein [Frateuria defendens]